MTEQVDVLICGSGSAGLCAAVWLARCGIHFKILEQRSAPLENGKADGVQCRTVEIFDSFGIAEDLLKEAYHVLEVAFWKSDGKGGLERTYYAADKETRLSHHPHVILNQARINDLMIAEIRRAAGRDHIEYGCEVTTVEVDSHSVDNQDAHCVTVRARRCGKEEKTYKAKYVLGCDGAHSVTRKALGYQMVGDSSDAIWGVMDVYPVTNFPDIRKKAVVHTDQGSVLIIPREGDFLVRFYLELRDAQVSDVTLETLHARARAVLDPSLKIPETVWWSAYRIGQRVVDHFHRDHRVFLTGDAAHTHSPKAGQGMNVSLQDGFNLGWKLAAVLKGQASRRILDTYVLERQKTATDLVEFDRVFTNLFSASYRQQNNITTEDFKDYFVKAGQYTAGQATHYNASMLTKPTAAAQMLAPGLTVGMRFHSAQVVRYCDAKAMQMLKALPSDARWHVVIFTGDIQTESGSKRIQQLSTALTPIITRFTPPDAELDSVIRPLLLFSGNRTAVEPSDIPALFRPANKRWGIQRLLHIFADDESYNSGHGHAYEKYGVDPTQGAMVVVRPDQYIAMICSLDEMKSVSDFFDGFLLPVKCGA